MTGATERVVEARPTAVIVQTTTWEAFPALWPVLLDEVWRAVRGRSEVAPGRNVMLYRDDVPNVEVGVELSRPCPLTGRVVASSLPAGVAATTVHRGSYAGLGDAHAAVRDWCAATGRMPTGTRWEVYGPHSDDPEQVWVEVSWLLAEE